MGTLEIVTYSLLCVEMVAVMSLVLIRRYLSARWQRKILAPFDNFKNFNYAFIPLFLLSLLFHDSYDRVKNVEAQTSSRDGTEIATRMQYYADKAFAQRNMYLSLFDLYLAILLWLLLGIKHEADAVAATPPGDRDSGSNESASMSMATRPAHASPSTEAKTDTSQANHLDNSLPGPTNSIWKRWTGRFSAGASGSTAPPTTQSSVVEQPRFRLTIHTPTTSSAMDQVHSRGLSTTNSSMGHSRRSESLETDPRSLQEIQEVSQRSRADIGSSTGLEGDDDGFKTDLRSLQEIQRTMRRGRGDGGSDRLLE